MIYLQLYWEFFKTGLFAVGGGMATIPFLREIALRVNIQKQDLVSILGKSRADAVHAGAFADAALLVGNGNNLCFRHIGFLLSQI